MGSVVIGNLKNFADSQKIGCVSSTTTTNSYSFVQFTVFWGGVFINVFFCAYSGRRDFYSFVQFWDGVFNNVFFCAYSGSRDFNSFVQFWDGVFNDGFSFVSGSYSLSPEDHRVQ